MLGAMFIRKYWKNLAIVTGAVIAGILLEVISEVPDPLMPDLEDEDLLSTEEYIAAGKDEEKPEAAKLAYDAPAL
ncbi:MAG: hypothetical protein IJH77_04855 [Mogibacterium sp.]|nr:hypothetical protein [Mogibacterium sp.]